MGMYTKAEFQLKLSLSTPDDLLAVFVDPVQNFESLKTSNNHSFFKCSHWDSFLQDEIYECHTTLHTFDDYLELTIYSKFRHYDNEIKLFLDLIQPFLYANLHEKLGEYQYEEDWEPTEVWYREGEFSYEPVDTQFLNPGYGKVSYSEDFTVLIRKHHLTAQQAANLIRKKTGELVALNEIKQWALTDKDTCPAWALIALDSAIELWLTKKF